MGVLAPLSVHARTQSLVSHRKLAEMFEGHICIAAQTPFQFNGVKEMPYGMFLCRRVCFNSKSNEITDPEDVIFDSMF
jgi:hypothetical protein